MNRHLYWLWLRLALAGNIKMMYALYVAVGDAEKIFRAERNDYIDWDVPQNYIPALTDKDLTQAYNIFGQCERFDIHIVSIEDEAYPASLRQIALPPCIIFYQGNLSCLDAPALTIIGTRYCTVGGEAIADEFARGLSLSGFTLVCGVAKGIEEAVFTAVKETDGRNVLVLPCGHLSVSKRVKFMMCDTVGRGAVISEMLPGEKTPPNAYHMRNRLLSALTPGTLVVQAPVKSGTQITASYALEQGKDVFVLPGSLRSPAYAGNNMLLRDGATPIIDFTDLVEYYKPRYGDQVQSAVIEDESFESFIRSVSESKKFDNEAQQRIYSAISSEGNTVDEIVMNSGIPTGKVLSELTFMEIKGWVESSPGGKYKIIV